MTIELESLEAAVCALQRELFKEGSQVCLRFHFFLTLYHLLTVKFLASRVICWHDERI